MNKNEEEKHMKEYYKLNKWDKKILILKTAWQDWNNMPRKKNKNK